MHGESFLFLLPSHLTPYLWGPRVTLSGRQWVAKHAGCSGGQWHAAAYQSACVPSSPAAERLGEITVLQSMVNKDKAVKVDLRVGNKSWRWSSTAPWPPIDNVLKAPFWAAPEYDPIRRRLQRPAPNVTVVGGGELLTVDFVAEPESLGAGQGGGEGGEGQEGGDAAVCAPPPVVLSLSPPL